MSAATTMSKLDKVTAVEAAALSAWQTYHRQAEPLGIDFGAKLLALRNEISARGKDGEGFAQWLKTHDIPRSTAYHCIARYEESIGARQPVPERSEEEAAEEAETASLFLAAIAEANMDRRARAADTRRTTKHIANMKAVVDAYAAKHPDVFADRDSVCNMEILDLALKAAPEGLLTPPLNSFNREQMATLAAYYERETAAPAVEDAELDALQTIADSLGTAAPPAPLKTYEKTDRGGSTRLKQLAREVAAKYEGVCEVKPATDGEVKTERVVLRLELNMTTIRLDTLLESLLK